MNTLIELIAGVDEVGRGPLAGPVVAAAVILNPQKPIEGLRDSKKLSPKRRDQIALQIQENALCYALGRAEACEIDQLNILQASLLAMQRALSKLLPPPTLALIDGLFCPKTFCKTRAIVRGDQSEPAISAASILAKVARDTEMIQLDEHYPGYGFAEHKGYPTRQHIAALHQLGISLIHRRSFGPVREMIHNR